MFLILLLKSNWLDVEELFLGCIRSYGCACLLPCQPYITASLWWYVTWEGQRSLHLHSFLRLLWLFRLHDSWRVVELIHLLLLKKNVSRTLYIAFIARGFHKIKYFNSWVWAVFQLLCIFFDFFYLYSVDFRKMSTYLLLLMIPKHYNLFGAIISVFFSFFFFFFAINTITKNNLERNRVHF